MVTPKLHSIHFDFLVKIDQIPLGHSSSRLTWWKLIVSIRGIVDVNSASVKSNSSELTLLQSTKGDHTSEQKPGELVRPDANTVREEPFVDGLRRVSHETTSFEIRLVQKPGQCATVIQMETKDE